MSVNRSLISPTGNPTLEQALRDKLKRRSETAGDLGELESLAIRLGLIQDTLTPRFRTPQLAIFAGDHGLAVDGIPTSPRLSTAAMVNGLLSSHLPVSVFARMQGLELSVIDCGIAETVNPNSRLLMRKIAHGTRNARITSAMSLDQAHSAIRAGMEIGDALAGNIVACAAVGVGSEQSAALVLSRLTGCPVRDLVNTGPAMTDDELSHLQVVLHGAQARHKDAADPVEVLAAFGGFETAVMVGVMLVAASKRHLVISDGLPACAALMVASRIAPAVVDYCLFTRSHSRQGLDTALTLLHSSALLELGMDSVDGTGATLAWPLVRSAAALLTDVVNDEEQPAAAAVTAARPGLDS